MRFLIVVHYFMPHIGGMEVVAMKQARSLCDLGHKVTVVTCRPNKSSSLIEEVEGITIVRLRAINTIEKRIGVTYPLISPFSIIKLMRLVKSSDIVHLHDIFYSTSHLAYMACRLLKHPYYITQHVAMVDHPSRLVMYVQHLVYGLMGDQIFRHARHVICYNPIVSGFLKTRGVKSDKITQNINGIDTRFYSPASTREKVLLRKKFGYDPQKPLILFVGRLVPKKGYDMVAAATSSRYLTLIVGGGDKSTVYEDDKDLRYFGSASSDQLRDIYRMSDIFVFPAVGEMLTLVMQEAMACGLPQVVTANKNYDEYKLDQRLIRFVEPTSASLRRSVGELLDDPGLISDMSEYSAHFARKYFDWNNNYSKEFAIYEK